MTRTPAKFTQADLARAVRAAEGQDMVLAPSRSTAAVNLGAAP